MTPPSDSEPRVALARGALPAPRVPRGGDRPGRCLPRARARCGGLERKFRACVVHARAVTAALAARADVREVVYLGVSAGGIFGAALLGTEPRIARAVLAFPGGDLPELIATSDEATVVAYRRARASAASTPIG